MDILLFLLILLFLYQALAPLIQKRSLEKERLALIHAIEEKRQSRVITMIHREETISFLNIPIQRSLSIEDSEQILEAIYLTPDDMPIDLILHTPGGLILATEQIAYALNRHKGRVTVFVPHYAMSGGTMLALAADEIVMSKNAVLGAIDPQIGSITSGIFPAISVLNALKHPNPHRNDQTLILGDIAQKAVEEIHKSVYTLLLRHQDEKSAQKIAALLTKGSWTHSRPLFFEEIKTVGLSVSKELPQEIFQLLVLYLQPSDMKKTVEFIPTEYKSSRK